MKAMIMAAGYGSRLGDETKSRPKILIDIGGITPLEWILRKLKSSGVSDAIINVHWYPDQVEAMGRKLAAKIGMGLSFSDERKELLDTAGGLHHAREFFDKEPFILYNGDIISDVDLIRLYSVNTGSGSVATLAVRNRPGDRVFLFDKEGFLGGWRNRATGEEIITGHPVADLTEMAFSAIAVLKPEIFTYLQEGVYSLRPVYLELSEKRLVNSYSHDNGFWIDIGRPEGLESCRKMLSAGK